MTSTFNHPIILEDDRVLLRPLKSEDLELLLPFALEEPELWKYSLQNGAGASGLKKYIEDALLAKDLGTAYPFIVFDKVQQKYAGSTRYYDYQSAQKNISLGYTWYGKLFQGTGINVHCKYLLLSQAFDTLGLQRVELRADERNVRSKAAMERLGFMYEGCLRQHALTHDGHWRNSVIYSILRNEWPSVKLNILSKF